MKDSFKNDPIVKKYEEYFEDDLLFVEEQLALIDELLNDIKDEINEYKKRPNVRGTGMLKVETYRNLIQAATQKQAIMKDRFSWKSKIIDLALKEKSKEVSEETEDLVSMINKLVNSEQNNQSPYNFTISKDEHENDMEIEKLKLETNNNMENDNEEELNDENNDTEEFDEIDYDEINYEAEESMSNQNIIELMKKMQSTDK